MQDTQDILRIKIDQAKMQLPEEVRRAIDNVPWKISILELRASKGYTFEQLGDLETETELVLCGLVKSDDYPKEIEKRLGISKAEANELVKRMNDLVFKKIKEEIIRNGEQKKVEKKEESKIDHTEEDRIMKSAGIEIKRDEVKVVGPKLNKLFEPVKIPVTNTDHSLSNITKEGEKTEKVILTASTEIEAPKEKIEISQTSTPKTENPPIQPATPKVMTDIKKPTISISKEEKIPDSKPASYTKNKDPYRMSPDE